jgi:hypothetical protein
MERICMTSSPYAFVEVPSHYDKYNKHVSSIIKRLSTRETVGHAVFWSYVKTANVAEKRYRTHLLYTTIKEGFTIGILCFRHNTEWQVNSISFYGHIDWETVSFSKYKMCTLSITTIFIYLKYCLLVSIWIGRYQTNIYKT